MRFRILFLMLSVLLKLELAGQTVNSSSVDFTNTSDSGTPTVISILKNIIWVKGGTFTMGQSDPNISCFGCSRDEQPAHSVIIPGFYIRKYEVTVAQFEFFIKATGYQTDAEKIGTSYIGNREWKETAGINWRHNESNHFME